MARRLQVTRLHTRSGGEAVRMWGHDNTRRTNSRTGAVLITGASTGIGRAIVLDLARRGVTVFAGVRRRDDAPTCNGLPGRIHEVLLDVTDQGQVDAAAATIRDLLDGETLRGVVNNAGVGVGGPLEFVSTNEMRRQFEVNLFGQLTVTRAVLDMIRAHGDGRIVFMSSLSGRIGVPFIGPYSISKHALNAMAECLRRELLAWRVQVSVLQPGAVVTPIWSKASDSAENVMNQLPTRAIELYGADMEGVRRYLAGSGRRGIFPEAVVRSARRALYARRARSVYVVGAQARAAVALSRALPTRTFDRLVARQIHSRGLG